MSELEQHEVDLQRLRGFRLMDDDFMSKCFEENIPCTGLVLSNFEDFCSITYSLRIDRLI